VGTALSTARGAPEFAGIARKTRHVDLSPEVLRLMHERDSERVWLQLLDSDQVDEFDGLAVAAGLRPLGRAWVEVDENRAHEVLTALLHKGLAYKNEVMPAHRAAWLASEFLRAFGHYDLKCATNTSDLPDQMPFGWTPATDNTFDCGLAVIGPLGAGVYWVADED
jgi:hypothetical protein